MKQNKIFNAPILIIINIIIIVATETIGNGMFFFNTGLIHLIAILFIALSLTRIFTKYPLIYDPTLKKFIRYAMFALVVFASSHLIEFLSYVVFKLHEHSTFANVANFYLISLITIILGSEYILKYNSVKKAITSGSIILKTIIVALIGLIITLFLNDTIISMELDSPIPYLYSVFLIGVVILGCMNLRNVIKVMPIFKEFSRFMIIAIIGIAFATMINIFYEHLEELLGLPIHQIIYLAHFGFYTSLSIMYLSFNTLLNVGGVYKDALKELSAYKE